MKVERVKQTQGNARRGEIVYSSFIVNMASKPRKMGHLVQDHKACSKAPYVYIPEASPRSQANARHKIDILTPVQARQAGISLATLG